MPSITVTAPNGKSLTIEGERVPTEAELHDIFTKAGVDTGATPPADFSAANAKDPQGNAVVRGLKAAWDEVTPIPTLRAVNGSLAKGLQHVLDGEPVAGAKSVWDDLSATVKQIGAAQGAEWDKAAAAAKTGDYYSAVRHGLAYAVPLMGPQLSKLADRGEHGDIAGMIGGTLGVGAASFGPEAASLLRNTGPVRALGERAQAAAESRVVDTMTPKVGANKVRFGNMAERVAPQLVEDIVKEGAPLSRGGLHDLVRDKLSAAEDALDSAASTRNPNQVIPTGPVLRDLRAKRTALTAQAHRPAPTVVGGMAVGDDVVPVHNEARVAQIDKAMDEIQRLGPVANYEALRRVRQSYDAPAKATYSPAVTADYMKAQGGKLGAADVTGVLRDTLAKMDPGTAAANAQYSIYRAANDVLEATAEVERSRPTVGRSIMASGVGAMAGEAAGAAFGQGPVGAAVGSVIGPLLERGLNGRVAPALRLGITRQLGVVADAIRSGRPTAIDASLKVLRPMVLSVMGERPSGAGPLAAPAVDRIAPEQSPR